MSRSEAVVWLTLAIVIAAAVTIGIAAPATDVLVGEAWSAFATSVP
jgi:hypothetical protein